MPDKHRTPEQKAAKRTVDALEQAQKALNGMRFTPANNIGKLLDVALSFARPELHRDDVEILF